MTEPRPEELETDDRFPSGPWIGFFTDKRKTGKQDMELALTFTGGKMYGTGRDPVAQFTLKGEYSTSDGKASWIKNYARSHDVTYAGFAEGKGIWGTWEMAPDYKGGFHIWPKGMGDPTQPAMGAEAEKELAAPFDTDAPDWMPEEELVPAGIGVGPGGDDEGEEWRRGEERPA